MIKISIDDDKRTCMIYRHWFWFWYRLNEKVVHLEKKDVTVYDFFYERLKWTRKDYKKIILGNYDFLKACTDKNNLYLQKYNQVAKTEKKVELKIFDKKDGWVFNRKKKKFRQLSFKDFMLEFLGYDDFCNGYEISKFGKKRTQEINGWNAYFFTKELDVNVCPYCNREYVFTIGNIKSKCGRPQIDHFFPKAEFPFLSCSLFNFVPSCSLCNVAKKNKYNLNKENEIVYPYNEGFEEILDDDTIKKRAYFCAIPGPNGVYEAQSVEIKYDDKCENDKEQRYLERIKNSVTAFHLQELYNCHKIELRDLLVRYRNYADPKIDQINKFFSPEIKKTCEIIKIELKRHLAKDEAEKMIKSLESLKSEIFDSCRKNMRNQILGIPLSSDDDEVKSDYPLKKFKNDIIEQLDIEKKSHTGGAQ